MNKNLMILIILAATNLVCACGDKAPACTTLSWGETKVEETVFDLKYSAGNQCENISDYWDVDVESIISKIQNMKFVKNDTCKIPDYDTGEGVEFECPDFIPEIIEFGEVTGCKFGTPPDEKSYCLAAPVNLYFSTDTYFETIYWTFAVENPQFYLGQEWEPGEFDVFSSRNGEKIISGQFYSEKLESVIIKFKWSEVSGEGMKEEKKVTLEYSVEVKE